MVGGGHVLDEAHVFRDEGYSGARLDRPGLDALRDAYQAEAISLAELTERRRQLAKERQDVERQREERDRLRQQRLRAETVRTDLAEFCGRMRSRLYRASFATSRRSCSC